MDQSKLEKLREKLLNLTEKEYEKLLDTSDDKEQWRWENSMRGKLNNPMKRPEVAEKIAKGKTGISRPKYVKNKIRETNKVKHAGKDNGHYGKGDKYKVTTPEGDTFIGTPLDIKEKYGLQPANLREYALRAKPCTKGKFKNFLFEIQNDEKK